jgi:hypothetical protein
MQKDSWHGDVVANIERSVFCIYALQDNGNLGAGNLTPLGLFFVIFGIGACFG